MIILIHVLIAISSLVAISCAFMRPTALLLRISYGLIAATLASGTYLVVVMPGHMVQACVTGLAYTAIALVGIVAVRVRLARRTVHVSDTV